MLKSNLQIWLRHFGIMMLVLVVTPAILLITLPNIPGTMGAGLKFGTFYYGVSYFLFGDWLVFFRGLLASLLQSKADIVGIFICWILVCIVVAAAQIVVARLQASRNN